MSIFLFLKLLERFKVGKIIYGFDHRKTEFETEFCTNDQHVMTKMYNFFMNYETRRNERL